MAVVSATDLQPVARVAERLRTALDRARALKPTTTLEPPLPTADLAEIIDSLHGDISEAYDQSYKFGAVETAARDVFYSRISSTGIDEAPFVEVWNLLDILSIGSDRGICAPELVCWLLEELLDSQTTNDCRTVFDYLESRRERLAQKDFHKKNLVFLRSCNELLRRLSRAEDATFCGRVFFFLFQTFPLGDKSSVNLRGEFHVENMTLFDEAKAANEDATRMDIDQGPTQTEVSTPSARARTPAKEGTPQPSAKAGSRAVPIRTPKKAPEEEVLGNTALYQIFWRLQQAFSDPTKLFKPANFQEFKKGLGATLLKFRKTPAVVQTRAVAEKSRGTKRKAEEVNSAEGNASFVDNYNPKYLTSRDLFDLELNDLAFQRHILVQALILLDFILSLTERSKKKILVVDHPNKSLLYDFTLSEEDNRWAESTRAAIKTHFHTTADGRFYDRMVETILARDKNWVRWKIESCPSIVRDAVPTEILLEARNGARKYTRSRRVDAKSMGAMDLSFLEEGQGGGLDALKDPSRYSSPGVEQLLDGIKADQLDLEMAMDDEEKSGIENMIQNKTWRLVRQTRSSRLRLLDKIELGEDLERVLRPRHTTDEVDEARAVAIEDDAEILGQEDPSSADSAPPVLPATA